MDIVIGAVSAAIILAVAYRTASIPLVIIVSLTAAAMCSYGFGVWQPTFPIAALGVLLAYLRRPVLFDASKGERPWAE